MRIGTYRKIGFSMYTFYVEKGNEKIFNRISCLKSPCEESTCHNIELEEVKNNLNLPDCSSFLFYKALGIMV